MSVSLEIPAQNRAAADACRAYLDTLTKPPGSLGILEQLAIRLSAIAGFPPKIERPRVLVFAGDHGVTAEGVSAYPKDVTPQMVLNFLRGGAAVNVLARLHGAGVTVIDVGVDADFSTLERPGTSAGADFVQAKVRRGTRNFLREDAMTASECSAAVQVGRDAVRAVIANGADCICIGEMGIGNTTAAAALTAALLNIDSDACAGRGTGVDDAGFTRKRAVLRGALERFRKSSSGALKSVGGLELAALSGACEFAASQRVPVVVDGYIASAGALAAVKANAAVAEYLIFSHQSAEPGHSRILEALDTRPILDLGLRLGEGTGAVLALPILRSACAIVAEMATFDGAGVSRK
jgi:nicotinate-nucleotide--dimethylbenzimidazole phosphoribosyltransferase